MSKMCGMNQCTEQRGLCGHEKMMLIAMMIAIIGGAAYWFLA